MVPIWTAERQVPDCCLFLLPTLPAIDESILECLTSLLEAAHKCTTQQKIPSWMRFIVSGFFHPRDEVERFAVQDYKPT